LRARIFILFDDVDFFHIFAKSRSKRYKKKLTPDVEQMSGFFLCCVFIIGMD